MKKFTMKKGIGASMLVAVLGLLPAGLLAQGYNVTLPQQCSPTTGGAEVLTFTTNQMPAGNGTLQIVYLGDLNSGSSEYIEFFDENGLLLGQTVAIGQCTNTGTFTYNIPQATLASWILAGSNVIITADASSGVNTGQGTLCGSNSFCVTATLTYTPITGPNDAGVASVDSPNVFCAGMQNVLATIYNSGTNTMDSVRVNWSLNGIQQPTLYYTTPLASYASAQLTLGSSNFTAPTTISVWTSNPNGVADTSNFNDTLTVVRGPALGGIYTIGGTSPDYPDFTTAVNALNNYGVCGPVTFHVRSGTYNEQIILGAITGISSVNTVTFTKDPSNTSPAMLTFAPSLSTSNYTIRFDGSSYITFDNLEISSTGSSYAHVFELVNCDYITIDSCMVTGVPGSTSSNTAIIYDESGTGSIANHVTFSNNNISGGSYTAYMYGGGSTSDEIGNKFLNNEISNFYYRGIYSYYQDSIEIIGNTISNDGTYGTPYGIYTYYNENHIFSKNDVQISTTSGGYGAYFSYSNNGITPLNRSEISNNFFSVNGSSSGSPIGFSLYNGSSVDVVHNNSLMNTGGTGGEAFYGYSSSTTYDDNRVLNNSFANLAGGLAVNISGSGVSSGTIVHDYNNYYSSGSSMGDYNGTLLPGLASWQSISNSDANSISANPFYISNTDLHVQNTYLNALATPISYIVDDIDGTPRASTPDIGADEFVPPALDAGILSIDTPGVKACSFGDVWATIYNYGLNTLDTVTVSWSLNGIPMSTIIYTGLGLVTSTDTMIQVGTTIIVPGDIIKVWTSAPNGMTENPSEAWNDTITRVVGQPGLNGTYTIGGPGADFNTLNAAVTDLANYGICGPVVFMVANGTYNEQLSLDFLPNMSAVNTVTFKSVSGDSSLVTITAAGASGSNYTVNFNGGSHYIFDGITLENTGTTYRTVVMFNGGSENVTIKNGQIITGTSTSTSSNQALIYSSSGSNDNFITFENNRMEGGSYTMYWYGSAAAAQAEGLVFSGNDVAVPGYYRGLYMLYQKDVTIHNNKIYATSGLYSSGYYWVYFSSCGRIEVTRNLIGGENPSYGYGLYLSSTGGSVQNRALVANNFFHYGSTSSSSYRYGVYFTGSGYIDFYHNNFKMESSSSNNMAMYMSSGSGARLFNNIIVNHTPGYGLYVGNNFVIEDSDYNNFYATAGNVGYMGGAHSNLQSWQQATGMDMNSFEVDPNYGPAEDLHVCNDTLENAGMFVGITEDFDGDGRPTAVPVSIGADEFIHANADLGPDTSFCQGGMITIGNPAVTGASYMWVTGDTTGTLDVSIPGEYTLTTSTTGCGAGFDTIIVTESPQPLALFTTNVSFLTITFNNGSSNATTYSWDFGDGTTSNLQNPVKVFPNSGFHTITLIATNECGSDTFTETINLQILSIPETSGDGTLTVYPNPSRDIFNVSVDGVEDGTYSVIVTTLPGQLVYEGQAGTGNGALRSQIDLRDIPAGVYLLQMNGPSGTLTTRLVKN